MYRTTDKYYCFGICMVSTGLTEDVFFYSAEKHLISSSGVVNTDLNLMGLTWLHNKIYLVFSKYTKNFIFSGSPPFRQHMNDDIVLPQLDEPDDVTSCSACQSIFVSDYSGKNRCFWKIQMPERRVTRHSVQGKPSKLSATSNDELLVIVRGDSRAFLAVYRSSDGSYLRNVDFPMEIGKPVRACKSASGRCTMSCTMSRASRPPARCRTRCEQ